MSAYGIYVVAGFAANAVMYYSPAMKVKIEKLKQDFRNVDESGVSDKFLDRLTVAASAVGIVVGSFTITLPALVVAHLMAMYKVDETKSDKSDDDDTTGAIKV